MDLKTIAGEVVSAIQHAESVALQVPTVMGTREVHFGRAAASILYALLGAFLNVDPAPAAAATEGATPPTAPPAQDAEPAPDDGQLSIALPDAPAPTAAGVPTLATLDAAADEFIASMQPVINDLIPIKADNNSVSVLPDEGILP